MVRRRKQESQTQRLVADILLGTERSLPRGVAEQLDLLAVARRRRVPSA
jgi:hypothetical protein